MRKTPSLAAIVTLAGALGVAGTSFGAITCRNPQGQTIQCGRPMVFQYCRDISTKQLARCGGPHVEPIPTAHH